jgi:hypothetical protein
MPLLSTRGAAAVRAFGFGAATGPSYWLGTTSSISNLSDLKIDDNGNIYVMGGYTFDFTFGYSRAYVLMYDKDGNIVWNKYYGQSSLASYTGYFIALDDPSSPSYLYCVGGNSASQKDILWKVDVSDGSAVWGREISGGNSWQTTGVAVSGTNVYAVGNHRSKARVSRYNTSGTFQNSQTYTHGSGAQSQGCHQAPSGDLYVYGWYTLTGYPLLMKLTSALSSPTWAYYTSSISGLSDFQGGASLVADSSGDLYWANYKPGATPTLVVGKFATSGSYTWTRQLTPSYSGGGFSNSLNFEGVSVDSDDNVYVSGLTNFRDNGLNTGFFYRLDSSGNFSLKRELKVQNTNLSSAFSTATVTAPTPNEGILCIVTSASGSTYTGVLHAPSDGTKTGTYTKGGKVYTYASTNVSQSTVSVSTTSVTISTDAESLSHGTTTMSVGDFTRALAPESI